MRRVSVWFYGQCGNPYPRPEQWLELFIGHTFQVPGSNRFMFGGSRATSSQDGKLDGDSMIHVGISGRNLVAEVLIEPLSTHCLNLPFLHLYGN